MTLGATQRIFDALGVRATLRTELPIVDRSPPQADAVHSWLCGYVGRRLASAGFEVRHEVEIGTGRFRGWVDVMGYRPADRSLVTTEIKTDLPDIGSLQRTTAWYEREAWAAARRFGWRPNRSGRGRAGTRQRRGRRAHSVQQRSASSRLSGKSAGLCDLARGIREPASRPMPCACRSGVTRASVAACLTDRRSARAKSICELRGCCGSAPRDAHLSYVRNTIEGSRAWVRLEIERKPAMSESSPERLCLIESDVIGRREPGCASSVPRSRSTRR